MKIDFNDILKILFIVDINYVSEYMNLVLEFETKNLFDSFLSQPTFLDTVAKGANKKTAIDIAIKNLAFNNYHLSTIGDFNNDFEMIRDSDLGFATDNAVNEIKEIAKYVVSNNNEHAIMEMILILENFFSK